MINETNLQMENYPDFCPLGKILYIAIVDIIIITITREIH